MININYIHEIPESRKKVHSKCCKASLQTRGYDHEGDTIYYICSKCLQPADMEIEGITQVPPWQVSSDWAVPENECKHEDVYLLCNEYICDGVSYSHRYHCENCKYAIPIVNQDTSWQERLKELCLSGDYPLIKELIDNLLTEEKKKWRENLQGDISKKWKIWQDNNDVRNFGYCDALEDILKILE